VATARRRRRLAAALLAAAGGAVLVLVLVLHATGGGGGSSGGERGVADADPDPRPVAAFAAQRLPTAISGEAIAQARGHLLVIGGLTAADTSSRQVLRLSEPRPAPGRAGSPRQPPPAAAGA